MPSWVGDVVMATPALALLRRHLRASFIGALVRPGLDELLAGSALADGSPLVDEFHVERSKGVMGPKVVASRIRPRRYDAALLLTNSFSTALITRLAFIPRRVGYDRDGRGLLLTQRLTPRLRSATEVAVGEGGGSGGGGGAGWLSRLGRDRFAPEPAVEYYLRAARSFLSGRNESSAQGDGDEPRMTLGVTPAQRTLGAEVLARAGVGAGEVFALINPGANNPAKRWPVERFGAIGAELARERGLRVLVTGSPDERELVENVTRAVNEEVARDGGRGRSGQERATGQHAVSLTACGVTLGALKAILSEREGSRSRCRVLITNDTGPRHIAAAFGVPTVTLFGPTDPRWTTLPPGQHPFVHVVADPDLPPEMLADDHPDRCAIEKISVERVRKAVEAVVGGGSGG